MKRKRHSIGTTFKPLKSFKPVTSLRAARRLTSEFHRRQEEAQHHGGRRRLVEDNEEAATSSSSDDDDNDNHNSTTVSRAQYQRASVLLTSTHKSTSKFVFRSLTRLGIGTNKRNNNNNVPLQVLEIGAVNLQLSSCPWLLNVEAIDINSRLPQVKEIDFFKYERDELFDGVVLAMVLNCVPDPVQRGEMLKKCFRHLKLGGWFVCVLPVRCLGESSEAFLTFTRRISLQCLFSESTPKIHRFFFVKSPQQEDWNQPITFKYHRFEIRVI